MIEVDGEVRRDYASLDSFVAYICTDGALRADTDGGSEKLAALESLLLPAEIDEAVLSGKGRFSKCIWYDMNAVGGTHVPPVEYCRWYRYDYGREIQGHYRMVFRKYARRGDRAALRFRI